LFGNLPDYSELTRDDIKEEKKQKKSLSGRTTVESDLDVSSPDGTSNERPEDEEEVSGIAFKRDIAFLKDKGITVSLRNGQFVYKRSGKSYKFAGTPAELADLIDNEVDVTKTAKKKPAKPVIRSSSRAENAPAPATKSFFTGLNRDAILKARQASAKDAASDPETEKEMKDKECKNNPKK
jgi:hypothetical protein